MGNGCYPCLLAVAGTIARPYDLGRDPVAWMQERGSYLLWYRGRVQVSSLVMLGVSLSYVPWTPCGDARGFVGGFAIEGGGDGGKGCGVELDRVRTRLLGREA